MTAVNIFVASLTLMTVVQEPNPPVATFATHVEELATRLKDPDPQARQAAVMMLSLAGPEAVAAVPSLLATLEDPVADVRAFGALALADIAPTSAPVRSALEVTLSRDESGSVRAAAAAALGKVASPSSVDPLVKALRDKDSRTRLEAVRALAGIQDDAVKRALVPVQELSKDSDSTMATEAAALAAKLRKR